MKTVAVNKTVSHDYLVLETFEAGLALLGSEVKSVRAGRVSLKEAYAEVRGGEVFLVKCNISPYEAANIFNHEPLRERKLLLHRREIKRLIGKVTEKGMTLIPLLVYFNQAGRVKVELGLAKGKKEHDKRDTEKERDWQRDKGRIMRERNR